MARCEASPAFIEAWSYRRAASRWGTAPRSTSVFTDRRRRAFQEKRRAGRGGRRSCEWPWTCLATRRPRRSHPTWRRD